MATYYRLLTNVQPVTLVHVTEHAKIILTRDKRLYE